MKTIFKMAAFCFAAATILVSCGDKVTGPEDIRVESVSVTPETKTLGITETVQLQVAITPTDATNKNVEWDSSDDAIATVSDSGLVTAVAEGTATITVTTVDGGKTDTCVITVGDGSIDPEVPVQSVSLSPETQNIPVGGNFTLTESVMPFEATNKSVTWSSSNDQVASVTDGVVTGVAVGTATITVTTVDGAFTDDCVVTVVSASPVTDVEFAYDSYNLPFGRKHKLTATIVPSNAVNKRLTWESSNSTIASVDQTGLVTVGSTAGTATITVTTEEGGFEATCEIKVVNAIGFLSDRTWTVDTQTWSDAVMVPACGKNTYVPATLGANGEFTGFLADCRQNSGYGDLFSYTYVIEKEAEICPAPWRAPSADDFRTLALALGAADGNFDANPEISRKMMDPATWGASRGGMVDSQNNMGRQGEAFFYWSTSETPNSTTMSLLITNKLDMYSLEAANRGAGNQVRCVK